MLKLSIFGLVSMLVVVGCGDPDEPGGSTIDEFLPAVANASCDGLAACLGPLAEIFFGDDDCAALLAEQILQSDLENIRGWIDSGRVIFRPEATGDCLSTIRAAGCDNDGFASEACERALEGTVATGDDCSHDVECVGTSYCDRSGLTCPGSCTARGGMGARCTNDDECDPLLTCGAGGTCAPPAQQGDACEGGTAPVCDDGLICAGSDEDTMTPGTCSTLDEAFSQAEGAACDLDAGMFCQLGLSCIVDMIGAGGATFVCAGPAVSGAACTFGVPDQCPTGEYCNADITMFVVDGTCTAKPTDGEPCIEGGITMVTGGGCAGGHVCVSMTCRARADNGMACEGDSQCYSNNCNSGTCAANPVCM